MGPALRMAHWKPHVQEAARRLQAGTRDQMGCSQEDSDPRNKARRTVPPPEREAPRLQRGLPVTSGLPHRPRHMGGGSRAVASGSLRTQLPPPSNLNSFMRWVALATLLLFV